MLAYTEYEYINTVQSDYFSIKIVLIFYIILIDYWYN